ncbi:MAG TPA: hypothetical protein VI457_00430 [Methylococcaceae bacterium]|nr:hypothetical protein [Methylococcaceae bacterium]
MIGGYLERLKAESGKRAIGELSKPPKAPADFPETRSQGTAKTAISPFDSFGSSHVVRFQKIEPSEPAETKPTLEPSRRLPTGQEAAELKALIRACGEPYGFSEADYAEAWARAVADVDAALTSYRHMAKVERVDVAELLAVPRPDDDRRRCLNCANLQPGEVCARAKRGTTFDPFAPVRYPMAELPRRCDGYAAKLRPVQHGGATRN